MNLGFVSTEEKVQKRNTQQRKVAALNTAIQQKKEAIIQQKKAAIEHQIRVENKRIL